MRQLRGYTTGYAVPQYVIDAPGGGGKIPINPAYIAEHTSERLVLRNYEGQTFEYPEASWDDDGDEMLAHGDVQFRDPKRNDISQDWD